MPDESVQRICINPTFPPSIELLIKSLLPTCGFKQFIQKKDNVPDERFQGTSSMITPTVTDECFPGTYSWLLRSAFERCHEQNSRRACSMDLFSKLLFPTSPFKRLFIKPVFLTSVFELLHDKTTAPDEHVQGFRS